MIRELSGFVATPWGRSPAIGGVEDNYSCNPAWPFDQDIWEVKFDVKEQSYIRQGIFRFDKYELVLIDYGLVVADGSFRPPRAYFIAKNDSIDYRRKSFFEVFNFQLENFAIRRPLGINIARMSRGFADIWRFLATRYPWIVDQDVTLDNVEPTVYGEVETSYGMCPCVNGSREMYQGVPWPFEHRYLHRKDEGHSLEGIMDLADWEPVAINFGGVWQLPRAIFQRENAFRSVSVTRGRPSRPPVFYVEREFEVANFLASSFARTPLWPGLLDKHPWLGDYILKFVRQGILWHGGWHPRHSTSEPASHRDGPGEMLTWIKDGKPLSDTMTKTAWNLVNHLWKNPGKKADYSTEQFARAVFGDAEELVDAARLGSHRKAANAFFGANRIGWRVRLANGYAEIKMLNAES